MCIPRPDWKKKQNLYSLEFGNIYNKFIECKRAGKAVTKLIKILKFIKMATIVIEDFNFYPID